MAGGWGAPALGFAGEVGRAASGGPRARWEQALRARSAGRAGLRGERELGQGEGARSAGPQVGSARGCWAEERRG